MEPTLVNGEILIAAYSPYIITALYDQASGDWHTPERQEVERPLPKSSNGDILGLNY